MKLLKRTAKPKILKRCPRWQAGYPCKLSRGLAYCADCGIKKAPRISEGPVGELFQWRFDPLTLIEATKLIRLRYRNIPCRLMIV